MAKNKSQIIHARNVSAEWLEVWNIVHAAAPYVHMGPYYCMCRN